jgi:hypothetical protein
LDPMGKCSNAFFSETTNMIKAKLYMNVHWMVLYNLKVSCSDMKFKMAAMIIHLQFGFSQFISFREEDLWNFSQSEHIIGPGSHIEYPTGTENSNFVEDHPGNIPAKFTWPKGPCEVLPLSVVHPLTFSYLVHLDQRSRWTIAITWRPSSVVRGPSSVVCRL